MAVSKRLRYEVLRRDNHCCRYCGSKAPEVVLTVDHVLPAALGGKDVAENLATACRDCNAGKSSSTPDTPLVQDVRSDALRWMRAQATAAEIIGGRFDEGTAYVEAVDKEWCAWTTRMDEPLARPNDWEFSVRRWFEYGLPEYVAVGLVALAMNARARDTWRYYCGCCWNKIKDIQQAAEQIIEVG